MRKPRDFVYVDNFPSIRELLRTRSAAEVGEMMGFQGLNEAVKAGKVRLAYELAAQALLNKKDSVVLIKCADSKREVFRNLAEAIGAEYREVEL